MAQMTTSQQEAVFSYIDKDLGKLNQLVKHQTILFSTVFSVLPLDLLSPSTFCKSVMLGWAGLAADGNDGIG